MPKFFSYITISLSIFISSTAVANDTTTVTLDTSKVYIAWRLTDNFSKIQTVEIDTSLDYHQIVNPLHYNSVLYNYLGNLASPAVNGVFVDRMYNEKFFMVQSIEPYILSPEKVLYYNTRKPITRVRYSTGVNDRDKEETLTFFHTQNIKQNLNFGINYHRVNSRGSYLFQNVKNNTGQVFLNYLGNKYTVYSNINITKYELSENGGFDDDVFYTQDSLGSEPKGIETIFNGVVGNSDYTAYATNIVKKKELFFMHKYRMGSNYTNDSVARKNEVNFEISHLFDYTAITKSYTHINTNGYYDNYFIDSNLVNDSITMHSLSNTIRLELNESGRLNAAIRADITNEYISYKWWVDEPTNKYNYLQSLDLSNRGDSLRFLAYKPYLVNRNGDTTSSFQDKYRKSNTFLSVALYNKLPRKWDWIAKGQYYFFGRRFGDLNFNGNLFRVFGADSLISIQLKGSYELSTPQYLYTQLYTNTLLWNASYQKENRVYMEGLVGLPKYGLTVRASQLNIYNFVYLNNKIEPRQLNRLLTVYTLTGEQKIKIGIFRSINRIAIQKSTDKDILDLPLISAMSRNYLKFTMRFPSTGGRLDNMVGFEARYHTPYYGDAYSPVLMSFHQQRNRQVGGYPYVDVFYNLKLKRVYFSAIYQHVNDQLLSDTGFDLVPHYYRNPGMFKVAVSWLFYN